MCGIAAIIGEAPDAGRVVEQMALALAHRGPDGAGTFVAGRAALGHRRLAVIDLTENGAQPMVSRDGGVAISYNGEIYNFAELRGELEALGRTFRSRSDTEVLLQLYEQYGDACVERLNGMFAFVIWDARQQRALAARDRFGQKPLFYSEVEGAVYFASEIKGLLAAPPIPRQVSLEAIDAYLTTNWIPAPLSIYRDIRRLEAGEIMVVEPGRPISRRRFSPTPPEPARLSYPEALETVSELFSNAVRRQIVADVPVGVFLSGGIDSTLVLSRAARLLPRGFDAFTVTYSDRETGELEHARRAAARVGATVHGVVVDPNDFASPDDLVSRFDEPFADVAAPAVLKLSESTRRLVTVALTGDGGDELFGGYEVHVAARYATYLGAGGRLRTRAAQIGRTLAATGALRKLGRGLSLAADDWRGVAVHLRGNLQADERRALLRPDVFARLGDADPYAFLLPRAPQDERSLFDPLRDRMLGDLFLHKTDIASMAWGLECRSPFLDVPLAEFARTLPPKLLIRGLKGKRILRDIVRREVDGGLSRRRKTGFSPPLDGWLAVELTHLLSEYLGDPGAAIYDLVSFGEVQRRVVEHRARKRSHRRVLWSLILLEAWFRKRGRP